MLSWEIEICWPEYGKTATGIRQTGLYLWLLSGYELSDMVFFPAVVFCKDRIDLLRRRHYMSHGHIVIHEIDDGGHKLAHIRFRIIRTLIQFRWLPGEIGCDHPVKPAVLIGPVKGIQSVGEKSEGAADEHTLCLHFLELP